MTRGLRIGTARTGAGLIVAIVAATLTISSARLTVFLATIALVPVVLAPIVAAIPAFPAAIALAVSPADTSSALGGLPARALPVTVVVALLSPVLTGVFISFLVPGLGLVLPRHLIISRGFDPDGGSEGDSGENCAPALSRGQTRDKSIKFPGVHETSPSPAALGTSIFLHPQA